MNKCRYLKVIRTLSIWVTAIVMISCHQRETASTKLFEINRSISCNDLLEQGYAWMPGEDVILFGRRAGDTLDYYHMDDRKSSFLFGSLLQDDEFIRQDPEVCDDLKPYWRNMQVEIDARDTLKVVDLIDPSKYTILEQEQDSYAIYWARVINKETLDTFLFSVYEREEKYFISSSITL